MTDTTTDPADTPKPGPARPTVVPYLIVDDARRAIELYTTVFGGRVTYEPIVMDDGRIGHTEITFGDSVVMLADEFPEMGYQGPTSRGGTTVALMLRVADADATVEAALAAGCRIERPMVEEHGSRAAWIFDPFGHRWNVGHLI